MNYAFWYDIAKYANEAWKGNFTEREVAINAYEYKEAWNNCLVFHVVMPEIISLLNNLLEDRAELYINGTHAQWAEVDTFIREIESEIKYWKLEVEEVRK